MTPTARSTIRGMAVLGAGALALLVSACGPEHEVTTADVVVVEAPEVPESPGDPLWEGAPVHDAEMLLQDLVDPRLMEPSTLRVRVQAMADATTIAFRLRWDDETMDDEPGPSRFPDGCAVQLPRASAPDLPAPQMGEAGRAVEIAYWRASWQAQVDGRGDSIKDLYPSAAVDHYPFEAAPLEDEPAEQREMAVRYAPARAAGGTMAGPRDNPVEALVAHGPGTLAPDESVEVAGVGAYSDGGWTVVVSRALPAALATGDRGQVAFAVWEGSHEEAGARKMRTGWIQLVRRVQ